MEGLFVSVTLVYTLLSCGLLLAAFFNFRSQPNRYLIVGFLAVCLHIVYKLIWVGWGNPSQYEIPLPFGLMYPVLLYLFARAYYRPEIAASYRQLMFLSLPFFLHLVLFVAACLQPTESGWIAGYAKIYYVSCMLSLLTFSTLTAKMYTNSKKPSTPTDILIRQLTMMCFGLVLLGYMVLYQVSVPDDDVGFEVRPMVYLFLALGFGLMIRYIITLSIPIFRGFNEGEAVLSKAEGEPNSTVQPSVVAEWAVVIEQELIRTQLYLNPSVSLDMLAQETAIPRHQLTQVFNGYYKKSFYQFIAAMRIEYAVRRISELGDTVTLDSLSYECGFNSKTSFNRYFKAYTGMTPSEYRTARQSITNQTLSIPQ